MGVLKAAGQFITGQYKESAETILNLINGFNFFNNWEVVVGIPEDTNVQRDEGLNNAALLYMHEQGVPSHNIPPRPVLRPAIQQEETRERIVSVMKDAAWSALVVGDAESARKGYEKAGMIGRDACKKWITDGTHLAPNAPSTIAKKMAKGDNKRGEPIPLVDTGSMLNSITYAVRKKR